MWGAEANYLRLPDSAPLLSPASEGWISAIMANHDNAYLILQNPKEDMHREPPKVTSS